MWDTAPGCPGPAPEDWRLATLFPSHPRGTPKMTVAIGWIAVVLTQVFYIPNTLKILRTRDVQGYSLAGWAMLTAGLSCYLVYFAARADVVGIVANCCGIAGAGLTTVCIWIWRDGHLESLAESGDGLVTANQG
jgi:uncharacterized protein with PQ loop repeat